MDCKYTAFLPCFFPLYLLETCRERHRLAALKSINPSLYLVDTSSRRPHALDTPVSRFFTTHSTSCRPFQRSASPLASQTPPTVRHPPSSSIDTFHQTRTVRRVAVVLSRFLHILDRVVLLYPTHLLSPTTAVRFLRYRADHLPQPRPSRCPPHRAIWPPFRSPMVIPHP